MADHWLNFSIVILVQLALFVVHAYFEGRLKEIPKLLSKGMCIGVPFGLMFDYLVGDFGGVFSYILGFSYPFLIFNWALSYGWMFANTLLMHRARYPHFYLWSVLVGMVYELANFFFPVWTWEFGSSYIYQILTVLLGGYTGLAILMAIVSQLLFRQRFLIFEKIFRR